MGGRKKKLKAKAAATDIGSAYRRPQVAATLRMASKNESATVVGLTWSGFK
jgi:hypothetical protein